MEQSSSLLWTILLAGLSKLLPISIPTLAVIASMAAGAGAVWYAQRLARLFGPTRYAVIGALIAATSVYFAYWTSGGMEMTLAALINVAFVFHFVRYLRSPSTSRPRLLVPVSLVIVAVMVATVRPEAIIVIGLAVLAFAALSGWVGRNGDLQVESGQPDAVRRSLYALAAIVIAALMVIAFRLLYFGQMLPQSFLAKSDGVNLRSIRSGAIYFYETVVSVPEVSVVILLAIAAAVPLLQRGRLAPTCPWPYRCCLSPRIWRS